MNKHDNPYNKTVFQYSFCNQKNTLLILCILCSIMYDFDKNLIEKWNIEILNVTTEYAIFYYNLHIIVVFKGTDTFSDILANIDLIKIDDDYSIPGLIHRGFQSKILENKKCVEIYDIIQNLQLPDAVGIYVTGHSLGGALASILYSYLIDKININITLITYGCPKVGDYEFAQYISCYSNFRVVNGNDLVCKLPSSLYISDYWLWKYFFLIFNYKHPSGKISIGKSKSYLFSVEDHHIDNYLLNLKKYFII